jgi:hypothetical protein
MAKDFRTVHLGIDKLDGCTSRVLVVKRNTGNYHSDGIASGAAKLVALQVPSGYESARWLPRAYCFSDAILRLAFRLPALCSAIMLHSLAAIIV